MNPVNIQNPVLIGVGFDTSRYGHHVTFLRADLQPACPAFEFLESRQGYDRVRLQFDQLARPDANVHFHIRLDTAGQYAVNLETFLRALPFPKTLTLGEPLRNAHYRQALFPKRKADPTESLCAARFALVEQPQATPVIAAPFMMLREIAQRLQAEVRQSTRLTNQLHNLLARVFPELALIVPDLQAGYILELLRRYPTPAQLARARSAALAAIAHLHADVALRLQTQAASSVASYQGDDAAALVRRLVKQLQASAAAQADLLKQLTTAYRQLPQANHLDTIPGIGVATAAILTAKIVSIERFQTPAQLVNYFGVFPEEESSGVDKNGVPRPGRHTHMSRKGDDLVRMYLWNAARCGVRYNPAVRALFLRLRARGCRGAVALGQCMRKLLHLVFAIWKSGKPFDANHYPWHSAGAGHEKTAGHNQDVNPEELVVAAVSSKLPPPPDTHQSNPQPPAPPTPAAACGNIDFAALRKQISMEQVLAQLGCLSQLRGAGPQRRGPCPIHGKQQPRQRSFSVHLGKGVFQCFHPPCAAKGNLLDLWAMVHRLALKEAAQHLAQTLGISLPLRTREEEPVAGTRKQTSKSEPTPIRGNP
jgi:transposase